MLKANRLQCERNDKILFSDLTFEVEPGSLLMVNGPNGSGKSSLLRMLAGLRRPSAGEIHWWGVPVIAGCDLLYIGHKTGILSALTPYEDLKWFCGIRSPIQQIDLMILSALSAVGLEEYQATPCEYLSAGQKQRVALARLWINPPSLIILDEPFVALDPEGQYLLQQRIRIHLKGGGLVIMASHQGSPEEVGEEDSDILQRCITLGANRDKLERVCGSL